MVDTYKSTFMSVYKHKIRVIATNIMAALQTAENVGITEDVIEELKKLKAELEEERKLKEAAIQKAAMVERKLRELEEKTGIKEKGNKNDEERTGESLERTAKTLRETKWKGDKDCKPEADNSTCSSLDNVFITDKTTKHSRPTSQGFSGKKKQKKDSEQSRTSSVSTPNKNEYQKTDGFSDMKGELYEVKLAALLFGRALNSGQDFRLATNMKVGGSFDDIVFKLGSHTMFLQLKHKSSDGKIQETQLVDLKGKLSLFKYCKSYCETKEQWKQPSSDLQDCGKIEDATFILYTNAEPGQIARTNVGISKDWHTVLSSCESGGCFFQLTKKSHPDIYKVFDDILYYKQLLSDDVATPEQLLEIGKKVCNKEKATKEEIQKVLESLGDLSDYEEFLSRLWLFTAQAAEDKLNDLIKKELRTACGKDTVYEDFYKEIENWWQNKKLSVYLMKETEFWQKLLLSCIGDISAPKSKQLNKLEIEFNSKILEHMRSSLMSAKRVHVITRGTPASIAFCCLKIVRSLTDKQYLLVDGSTLQARYNEILALWGKWCDLLIVVEDGLTPTDVIHGHLNKRLIYVSSNSESGADYNKVFKVIKDTVDWKQIAKTSQDSVLSKHVKFQGHKVCLREVTGDEEYVNDSIDCDALMQLLAGELILGESLDTDVNYYVPQKLQYQHTVNKEMLSIIAPHVCYAISGSNKRELQKLVPRNETILTLDEFKSLRGNCYYVLITGEEEFFELQKFRETVHWFHYEAGNFKWKRSKGDLTILQKHLNNEISLTENVDSAVDVGHHTAIVSADPGMGKSTLLCHLALSTKKTHPNMWVICVNLNDFTHQLNKLPENLELQHVTEFLVETSNIVKEWKDLFRCKLASMENVCVLFDSYDEISPFYSDKVTEMFRHLQTTKLKTMWITTRPVMRRKLEKELSLLSFTLQTFPESDQRGLLANFWKVKFPGIDESRLDNFISELLLLTARNLKDRDKQFTGIPLQSMMLAEAFENELKIFIDTNQIKLPQKFDLLQLYEKFVDRKFQLYYEKNKVDFERVAVRDDYKKLKELSKSNHMISALLTLLAPDDIASLDNSESIRKEFEIFANKFKEGHEKLGIIKEVTKDKPTFIHQTFAEYFAALWFAKNYKSLKLSFIERLYDRNFQIVRNFFDRILSQNFELHIAVLNQEKDLVEELASKMDVNIRDKGGRTALHLAVMNHIDSSEDASSNVCEEIVSILLEYEADPGLTDEVSSWKPLRLADKIKAWSAVEMLLQKKADSTDLVFTKQNVHNHEYMCEVLKVAAERGFEHLIGFLLKCGVDCSYMIDGAPLIHIAFKHKQLRLLQFLIENGSHIDQLNSTGSTLLQEACKQGNWDDVQQLIKLGADINVRDKNGNTALHRAARMGNLDFVKNLIQAGCDKNVLGECGNTALHEASRGGELLIVRYLVEHGADLQKCNENDESMLHFAAVSGNMELVTYFLDNGFEVDCRNHKGQTPLFWAILNEKLNVVKLLLDRGAELAASDSEGNNALHYAAMSGNLELLTYLINKGLPIDSQNDSMQTPLMKAAENGKLNAVKFLLKRGTNLEMRDKDGTSVRDYAARSGNIELLTYLMNKENCNDDQLVPVLKAAKEGSFDVVKFLVENDDDNLKLCDKSGNSILHWAASSGSEKLVAFLLDSGLNINILNNEGETPLMKAAETGNENMVRFLIRNNCDLTARDKYGNNVLHSAAWSGDAEVIKLLLDNGLNPDGRNQRQETPLWWAARSGRLEVAQLLCERNADLNIQDSVNGFTPLHEAARCGFKSIVQCLISHGANTEILDNFARLPLEIIEQFGHDKE